MEEDMINTLLQDYEAARRERNQAVKDIQMLGRMGQNICPVCAHYNHGNGCDECKVCFIEDNFKWRGVQDG